MQHCMRIVATAALWLIIASGAIAFGFFYSVTPTRWFNVRATDLISWRSTLVLQYKFANAATGRATPLLSSTVSFMLIWQWCGTLAAALGAAGLLWLAAASASTSTTSATHRKNSSKGSIVAAARKAVIRAGRLLRCRVPPGALWRTLLGPGGLSFLDLLLILLWFGLHIMWMYEMTMRVLDRRRTRPPPPKPRSSPVGVKALPPPTITKTFNPPITATAPPPKANINTVAGSGGVRRLLQSPTTANTSSNTTTTSSIAPTPSVNSTKVPTPSVTATKAPPPKALRPPPPKIKPLPVVVQDSVAKYFGWVSRLDILLLFFPLPRCNFLHWLLGSDFATLVKYHRWLGHGTLMVCTLHGIIYMGIWTRDGILSTMLDWGMSAGVNRLAGLVALCGGWLLWITSIPIVRRKLFNLFYLAHILGATVFMLFAFMHRKDVATWVMPGIFLYLLDVVLRTIQQNFNSTCVSAAADAGCAACATVSQKGGVLTLSIQCDQSLTWVGSDIVFLNVPAVSWWQWHSFTIACSSTGIPAANATSSKSSFASPRENKAGDSSSAAKLMVLHIKKYDRWTQRLIARLATDPTPVKLYVSGPYSSANRKWITSYDSHVFIAGGIGVTPVLGMLQELIAHRRAAEAVAAAPESRVSFVWVSRNPDEFSILPPEILREASRGKDGWLDLQLYLTGGSAPSDALPTDTAAVQDGKAAALKSSPSQLRSLDGGKADGDGASVVAVRAPSAAAYVAPVAAMSVTGAVGSIFTAKTTMRPLAHPYMSTPWLWMVAVVLCFGGGFAGLVCALAYDAHMSRTVKVRDDFSYVGMLQFAALGLGAVLPPAALMLVAHIYRWWTTRTPTRVAASKQASNLSSAHLAADVVPALTSAVSPTTTDASTTSLTAVAPTAAATTTATTTTNPQSDDSSSDKEEPANTACAKTDCEKEGVSLGSEAFLFCGRPDIPTMLAQVARDGRLGGVEPFGTSDSFSDGGSPAGAGSGGGAPVQEACFGVFVAGPARLVGGVDAACASLNGLWGRRGRAYLDVHSLTHEL